MSDVSLGRLKFEVDTSPLSAGDLALQRLAQTASASGAIIERFAASSAAAFAKVPAAFGGSGAQVITQAIGAQAAAQTGLAAATGVATGAIGAQGTALHASVSAHSAHGSAVYANRLQMLELAHVGRALFDEMAAGGNVFRALAMEGGRLQIALSSGEGGLGGLVTRLGAGFAAMMSPMVLATVGIAAFGVAAAAAFATYEAGQDKLATSLNGIGRRSGATVAQLNQVAAGGAASGGISSSQALDLAAQYTSAGLTPGLSQSLIGMTRDYGRVTDTSTSDAGTALAAAMRDPIKGMGDLDKSLGFVDDRLAQTVTNLERSGHLQEAQAALMDGLNKALAQSTDTTWTFSKALAGAENFLSNAFSAAGHGVASALGLNSNAEKLATLQSQAANLQRVDPVGYADEIAQMQREISRLTGLVNGENARAAANQRDQRATDLSRQGGDAVRSILPDLVRAQTAANQIEVLRQAMSDPLILQKMQAGNIGGAQIQQAFGNAVVMQGMGRPGVQDRQNYDLSLASADAFSVGEKAVVEARRAELDVLRQTGDVARAATVAQMSMNEAIAKGNQDAEDRLQKSKQDADLVGLTGLARSQQEIRNRYEGYGGIFDRDAVTSSNALKDPGIQSDLAGATTRIKNALDDLPAHLQGFAAALDGTASRVSGGAHASSPYGGLGGVSFGSGPGIATPAMIADASARTGIPAPIIASIGQIENGGRLTGGTTMLGSNGRPSTAWGYGQLTNGAAADVAGAVPGFSKYDPSTAVFGSAEYLSILAGRNHGNMTAALNAYGGTPTYASRVMALAGGGIPIPSGGTPLTVTPGAASAALAPIAPNMLGKDQSAETTDLNADKLSKSLAPLINAQQQIDALNASLKTQADTFGQTADKIQGAAFAQNLLNEYQKEGVTITPALAASVKDLGGQYGSYARQAQQQQDQQKSFIGTEDSIRSFTSSSADSLFTGLAQHKPGNQLLRGIGLNLGNSLIHSGVGSITNGLFGKQGQAGGGLLGGLLGDALNILPHFAGGAHDAPGGPTVVGESGPEVVSMPAHAQVTPNSALGNMRGAGATNVQFGDVHIHPVGGAQFTDDQISQIRGQVAAGQQDTMQQITRNFGQLQSDSTQT